MKKIQITARITVCICLFLALFFVAFFGIQFLGVPAVTNTDQMNVAPDLAAGYTLKLTPAQNFDATYEILSARLDSLPYDDVFLTRGENQTLILSVPRHLGGGAFTIAQTLCGTGKISYTDINGQEVIPAEAIERAQVGYGVLDPSLNSPVYYLEFFLKDEFRQSFREATKKLSESGTGKNIMSVNMDGSAILQATVSEEMTEESFIMGGRFSDAILPNLYAAYVNTPSLEQAVSYGNVTEIPPQLGTSAYPLLLSLPFVASLIAAAVLFFCFRRLSLPVFFTLLTYCFIFLLFFQVSLERISSLSFLASLSSILMMTAFFCIFILKTGKEMRIGRDRDTAFNNALKASTLPLFLSFGIWALISGILFAVFGAVSLELRDFLLVFFLSSLFALLFGYLLLRLFLQLQNTLNFVVKKPLFSHKK